MVRTALFAAALAVAARISITLPLTPVPFTLSVAAVMLCGLIMPPAQAALATVVYIAIGMIGAPVFAGFMGGIARIAAPAGGFIMAYIPMAAATAFAVKKLSKKTFFGLFMSALAALPICYLFGGIWFSVMTGASVAAALSSAVLPFIPFDVAKALLAAAAARVLQRALK